MVSKVDLLILGLLLDRPMHGYEISQVIASEDISIWLTVSLTSIYYSLGKLRRNGFIVETVHRSETSPERSVYHLTDRGRASFFDLLEKSLASAERPSFDFDLAAFFANRLPRHKVAQLLEKRRSLLAEWHAAVCATLAEADRAAESSPKVAILQHSQAFVRMEQEWLNGLLAQLQEDREAPARPDQQQRQLMILQGDLSAMHLPDVLKSIAAGRLTGTLSLQAGASVCAISFRDGRPVYVTAREDGVAAPDADATLHHIYQAFGWPNGHMMFQQDQTIPEDGIPVSLSVDQIILEGTRQVDNWNTIRSFVPSPETVFERVDCSSVQELDLRAEERETLQALDGFRDVRDIISLVGLSEFETSKTLYTLFAVGLLRTVDRDRVRMRRVFRHLVESLYRAVLLLAGPRAAETCELTVNARQGGEPGIRLVQGKLLDEMAAGWDVPRQAQAYADFLESECEAVAEQMGRNFVQQSLERILREVTPDLQEVAARCGFDRWAETGKTERKRVAR